MCQNQRRSQGIKMKEKDWQLNGEAEKNAHDPQYFSKQGKNVLKNYFQTLVSPEHYS